GPRRSPRPRYIALALALVVPVGVPVALPQVSLPLLVAPAAIGTIAALAGLPIGWWRYRHDVAWGFARQTPRTWAVDQLKSLAIGAVLVFLALVPLFLLVRAFPHGWPWPAPPPAPPPVLPPR